MGDSIELGRVLMSANGSLWDVLVPWVFIAGDSIKLIGKVSVEMSFGSTDCLSYQGKQSATS